MNDLGEDFWMVILPGTVALHVVFINALVGLFLKGT